MTTDKKKRRLTQREVCIVYDMLKTRLTVIDNGYCEYIMKYSDASVASEARNAGVDGCNPGNVESVRKNNFGMLREEAYSSKTVPMAVYMALANDVTDILDFMTRQYGPDWRKDLLRQ